MRAILPIAPSPYADCDLDAVMTLGNVDRLPRSLEIDGVFYPPVAFLVAQDINVATGAWASRHDPTKILSVSGAGTDPTYGNVTAIDNPSAKYLVSQKYHIAADNTWAQLTAADFMIEIVYVHDPQIENIPFKTWNGTRGYGLYNNGVNQTTFYFNDGSTSIQSLVNVTPTTGAVYHLLAFGDRSENLYGYANGGFADTRALTGLSGDMSIGSGALRIGNGGSQIISFGLWNLATNPFPGVLKNRTYFDRIARERFAVVAGIQDLRCGKHSFTRATPAYTERYISSTERRLFPVSAGWPRVGEAKDATGALGRYALIEPQATNRLLYSEDFTNGAWTRSALTTVSSNGRTAPDGEMTMDGLVATAATSGHNIYQTYNTPATLHCFSVVAERGDKDWIWMQWGTNLSLFVDLVNGVIGDYAGSAVLASGVENLGAGRFRAFGVYTGEGVNMNYSIHSAPDNSTNVFLGDGVTVNTWLWGAQVEAVTEYHPSSYIKTLGAAVARNADLLTYDVRLPLVGNVDVLPQDLTIGGTDYAPAAFLVADDCDPATGAWPSRHDPAKALAYAGSGTDPSPRWDAFSRGNRTVRYWASKYHLAADTTWGQLTTGDSAFELIIRVDDATTGGRLICSTYSGGTGFFVYVNLGYVIVRLYRGSVDKCTAQIPVVHGRAYHIFIGVDESDKMYLIVDGNYVGTAAITALGGSITGGALALGAHPAGGNMGGSEICVLGIWDLPTNPWPGVATNQAVITAIARARFDLIAQARAYRLDCEVLLPNADSQVARTLVSAYTGQAEYSSIHVGAGDVCYSQAGYSNTWQWTSATTTGTTDCQDNVARKISIAARTNAARYKENDVTIATDTSCVIPAGNTRVTVGDWLGLGFTLGGRIRRVKLWRADR